MQLQADSDSKISVSGDLTLNSVTSVLKESGRLITSATRIIDLANVSRVDSAGLALLLEWQSNARSTGPGFGFENVPEDLLRLAALTDASALLGFKAQSAAGEQA